MYNSYMYITRGYVTQSGLFLFSAGKIIRKRKCILIRKIFPFGIQLMLCA